MRTIISIFLLAVVALIHCQEHEQMIVFTLQGILETVKGISNAMKDMQQKLGNLESNYQDVQLKLGNLETNFQELHHELEHVKGAAVNNQEFLQRYEETLKNIPDMQQKLEQLDDNIQGLSQETGQCLRGDDLEHLTNVSAAAHQEIKSFVHEEISGVISLAQKDECSEGSLLCGSRGTCTDTLFSFTCSCPSGFTWDGSECEDINECIQGKADCSSLSTCTNTLGSYSCSCNPPSEGDGRTCSCPPQGFASNGDICEDIDECAEGKGVCHPNATCQNTFGNYSCSCNKPFEGDGRTSCEFQCRIQARFIRGLGCVKIVKERKTYEQIEAICREEGGRMVQHFNNKQLQDIYGQFGLGLWVGVYDEKWTSDESLVPEDLWWEGQRSDPSRRCGVLAGYSSSSLKLTQRDCSEKHRGLCQFQLP